MELGEPDESGRRSPVEVPGSEFEIDCDAVIMSLGTSPNPLISSTTEGLEINRSGEALAKEVIDTINTKPSNYAPLYSDDMPIKDKIGTVATEIYGADGVTYTPAASKQIAKIEEMGFGKLPVCMAKTQYSLSDDPNLLGRPTGYNITVREVYVSAGAGFVVALTGAIMTMPGLPKHPAAYDIDVDENGKITGLF